jgi:hypothetical protein
MAWVSWSVSRICREAKILNDRGSAVFVSPRKSINIPKRGTKPDDFERHACLINLVCTCSSSSSIRILTSISLSLSPPLSLSLQIFCYIAASSTWVLATLR